MLLAASPLFGSVGLLGIALGVCFILLVMVRSSRPVNLEGPGADPVEDLTYRLRHPARWAAAHPLRAITRNIAR